MKTPTDKILAALAEPQRSRSLPLLDETWLRDPPPGEGHAALLARVKRKRLAAVLSALLGRKVLS